MASCPARVTHDVAIDGKRLRRGGATLRVDAASTTRAVAPRALCTTRPARCARRVHMLHAFSTKLQAAVGSLTVPPDSGECIVVPEARFAAPPSS